VAGVALLPGDDGTHLRVDVLDGTVTAAPVPAGAGAQPLWISNRGDGRNSGAYPFAVPVSATGPVALGGRLSVYPNPGAGRFRFSVDSAVAGPVGAEIYDLRGRHVRQLRATGIGDLVWDGRNEGGRPSAAGTYFAVVRADGRSWTTRFILTR
jgi:hypothetical protein